MEIVAQLLFGNSHCVGQLAAMGVDGVHLVLRHAAGAVENDGEAGQTLLYLVQNVECQRRRNELARLRIACALLGSKFVSAVARTDGDGQAVATATG